MAQLILNIPDVKEQRVADAFVKVYGWHDGLGITKRQFIKKKIRDFIVEVVVRAEGSEAQRAAIAAIQAEADAIDIT